MRVFLLPISTRRTLLYAHRLGAADGTAAAASAATASAATRQSWGERIQSRAAKTWADWEKRDKGWQKMVVSYGSHALRRIPYEEWGLKSVPPLSQRRRVREEAGTDEAEVVFPGRLIPADRVGPVLRALSTEREALHKKRLVWCLVGMPLTAPVALIPLIPNIPFFYLVYRAWSHWRALAGGRHIQFLLDRGLLKPRPSALLDDVYARQPPPLPSTDPPTTAAGEPAGAGDPRNLDPRAPPGAQPEGEVLLLSQESAARMAQLLDLPPLEVELERAIWQVETAVHKQNEEQRAARAGAAAGVPGPGAGKETIDEKKSQ